MPQFLYFHLIIIVLLITNLVMFCCFLFQFTCGAWQDCLTQTCVRNYKIAAELFFLMGINWITEVTPNSQSGRKEMITFFPQSASFMVGWFDKPHWNHPVFQVLDFVNWSIGIILLVFFLCKLSNRSLIKTLLLGSSSTNEGSMVKTMTSQVSNLSSDSKFNIRINSSISLGQNKQTV